MSLPKEFQVISNVKIAPAIYQMQVFAPQIAKRRQPGQFVILRVRDDGERVPFTIASTDIEQGSLFLIYQVVGKSTVQMAMLTHGDHLQDLVGPLGKASHIRHYGSVVCVGGGIGAAPIYPIVSALKQAGNHLTTIIGAKSKDHLILQQELARTSDQLIVMTDDGSSGEKGFVTHALSRLYELQTDIHHVFAIGPPIMMKNVSALTHAYSTPTTVSLNPIMVDGTGMCGGCRVIIGNEAKFACVDGPEFNGHEVNYDILMQRLSAYRDQEADAIASFACQMQHDLRAQEILKDVRR